MIDQDGGQLGIFNIDDAKQKAYEVNLDLVEISPDANPPVCKILDFKRYQYEAKKKLQEAKKKQKKTALKEMKFKVNIDEGDFKNHLKKIRKFIESGDKVKVSLWFRGREIIHKERGEELFNKIIANLQDIAKIDSHPKIDGKQMIMMLSKNSH